MFVNISNHPSPKWGEDQLSAAKALGGDIRDIQFPNVPASASMAEVAALAATLVEQCAPGDVVMIMGETSLVYTTIRSLLAKGARVVVTTTERRSVEVTNPDGSVTKTAVFGFVAFREIV